MRRTGLYILFGIIVVLLAGFVIGYTVWSRTGRVEEKTSDLTISSSHQNTSITLYNEDQDTSVIVYYGEAPATINDLPSGNYYIAAVAQGEYTCPYTQSFELGSEGSVNFYIQIKEDEGCWEPVD